MSDKIILLDHGEGGAASARLVSELFLTRLGRPDVLEDAAVVPGAARLAISTDSFVVRPSVFPGGDIGKLSVCGTVNDLAVMGATPRYLTAAFIIEEGTKISLLERIVDSMAATAAEAGVKIVSGDTKVVGRGELDGVYINTTGVGIFEREPLSSGSCKVGDAILISGPVGDHGTAVMMEREGFGLTADLISDCQPLGDLCEVLQDAGVRCMRDPTRGGLATTLLEIAEASGVRMRLEEPDIPVRPAVAGSCELLGLDPLYVACEGRVIAIVPAEHEEAALKAARSHARGADSAIIGHIIESDRPGLEMIAVHGGRRELRALEGAQLPRIC